MGAETAAAVQVGSLMHRVVDQAIHYLSNEIGLDAALSATGHRPVRPQLTSTLRIAGAFDGQICLTAGERTISEIVNRMLGNSVSAAEMPSLLADMLCELLNVIVGNACRTLDNDGLRIFVEPPSPMSPCGGDRTAALHEDFFRQVIQTSAGPVMLHYWEAPLRPATD